MTAYNSNDAKPISQSDKDESDSESSDVFNDYESSDDWSSSNTSYDIPTLSDNGETWNDLSDAERTHLASQGQ